MSNLAGADRWRATEGATLEKRRKLLQEYRSGAVDCTVAMCGTKVAAKVAFASGPGVNGEERKCTRDFASFFKRRGMSLKTVDLTSFKRD